MLDRLAVKNANKVRIIKVNTATEARWAGRENIQSIPAFQIFSAGEKIKQFEGAPSEGELQEMIDSYAAKAKQKSSSQEGPVKKGSLGGKKILEAVKPNPKPEVKTKSKTKPTGQFAAEAVPEPEPTIKPMPKNWLPPGISRKN